MARTHGGYKLGNQELEKAVDKAIESHRQDVIQRLNEDQATAEHDEHDDGFNIDPDPYCRLCREDGFLDTEDF